MKKILLGALLLATVAAGCAITDYPVILDRRGGFDGVVRTGHKAYIVPTSQVATIFDDGSDELFSMVYQNQFGDQKLYTFNNYDPTASVLLLDQTYCDWRYDGCEIVRAWNPADGAIDDPYDYEFFPDCSGARSLSLLVSQTSRLAECGDRLFAADRQDLMGEFAGLATTGWRGGTAYVLPVNAGTTVIALNGVSVPIYGQITGFVTDEFDVVLPMTPNVRHELAWLADFVATNGREANVTVSYGSIDANVKLAFAPDGLAYNLNRF